MDTGRPRPIPGDGSTWRRRRARVDPPSAARRRCGRVAVHRWGRGGGWLDRGHGISISWCFEDAKG